MFWQRLQGRTGTIAATGFALAAAGYLIYNSIRSQPTDPVVQRGHSKKNDQKSANSATPDTSLKRKAFNVIENANHFPRKRARSEPIYVKGKAIVSTSPIVRQILVNRPLEPTDSLTQVKAKVIYSEASSEPGESDSDSETEMLEDFSEASSESSKSDSDSETDELKDFRETIDAIDFQKLESIALRIRTKVHETLNQSTGDQYDLPEDLSCEIDRDPRHGTFNLAYIVLFSDGQKWIARVPGNGTNLSSLDKVKMKSEYETTQLIRNNTQIPIPEVHYFSLDSSEIGSAFALMDFVHGVSLDEVWDKVLSQHERRKILNDVAKYMSQLQTLQYNNIGVLDFDERENKATVRPQIYFSGGHHGEAEVPWGKSYEARPCTTYAERLRNGWNNHEHPTKRAECDNLILDIAVESIPDHLDSNCSKTLNMPDLNLHNILVDDDSTIVALLDWDMVGIMPTSIGCAKFPPWIVQDWTDPSLFQYEGRAPFVSKNEADAEQSLRLANEQTLRYRQYYAVCYRKYMARRGIKYDPRTTKASYLLQAIESAVHHRERRADIVSKLLQHAFGGEPPFTRKAYGDAFEGGSTMEYDDMLRNAFARMWEVES